MDAQLRARPNLATSVALMALCVGVGAVSLSPSGALVNSFALTLLACAIVAELAAARYSTHLTVSGSFVTAMLAVGFLGPAAAALLPLIAHLAAWSVDRYRWRALLNNISGSSVPAVFAALIVQQVDP